MLLGPRVLGGSNGYDIVTPLVRSDASTVLVNRGFVTKDSVSKAMSQVDDSEVEILGLLRTSHARNIFTPDNRPKEGTWFWADVDAMTEYAGGQKAGVQPVYVEQIFGKFYGLGSIFFLIDSPKMDMLAKWHLGFLRVSRLGGHQ
jgi:surfeit locus 1 family protein